MRFGDTLLCLCWCGRDRSTTSIPVSVMLVAFVVGMVARSADVTSRPGCMVGLCLTRLSSFSRCPGWLTRTLARAPFAVWPCATALHGCSALSCACALLRASPANQTTLRHTPLYASSALRDVDMRASPPPPPLLATQPRRPVTHLTTTSSSPAQHSLVFPP